MDIEGKKYKVIDTYDNIVTIPDCFVLGKNKLGVGHGEGKLYLGSKDKMRTFFGTEGFDARCFLLKEDLITYILTLKNEYLSPSQNYIGREDFPRLWGERLKKVQNLEDIIFFSVKDQTQITGPRGYVNSLEDGYKLIRELSLPLVSYVSIMQVGSSSSAPLYYWKLFVDFEIISQKKNVPLVFSYGKSGETKEETKSEPKNKKKEDEIRNARIGQGKYRERLLEDCPYCPITMVNDERLLIASHIKPWAVSDDTEKIDPKNGFMLSPLYDKLFDRGFITFTEDKHMVISNWLSPQNVKRLRLEDNLYVPRLPLDDKRLYYLNYHRQSVFKGTI